VPLDLAGLSGDQIEQVGQGSYLVNAVGDCNSCHTSDPTKFLAGGVVFGGPMAPFTVTTRNLTPDPTSGLPADIHNVDQFVNALRTGADYHGVADGGTPTQTLLVMPWAAFRWMSTPDLKAIYAYLSAIPAVSNAIAADTKPAIPPGPAPTAYSEGDWAAAPPLPPEVDGQGHPIPDPGNLLRGLAINPLKEVKAPTDPTNLALFARGAYLFSAVADCSGCHTNTQPPGSPTVFTKFLGGGQVFVTPPPLQPIVHIVRSASANLVGPANGFFNKPSMSFSTFLTLITQGVHAEDPMPKPVAWPMPWPVFKHMTLSDLQSIYVFVSAVAVQFGQPTLAGALDKVVPDPALYCDATNGCPMGFACSSTNGECLAQTCTAATVLTDCAVCQTCTGGKCTAPGPADACLTAGY
jgi:mono/diheme cytochrome c family protein